MKEWQSTCHSGSARRYETDSPCTDQPIGKPYPQRGRVRAALRGTDSVAEVCDRREGQTAQPADLNREQHAGGAGWPEPRSDTQPERRAWPCASLSVRRAGRFPSRAQRSGGRWAADDPRRAVDGGGTGLLRSSLIMCRSSRSCPLLEMLMTSGSYGTLFYLSRYSRSLSLRKRLTPLSWCVELAYFGLLRHHATLDAEDGSDLASFD